MKQLLALLADINVRRQVHTKVRQAFVGESALCAATVSDYLIRAGVLNGYRPWTADLDSALRQRGWTKVSLANLLPGDVVFTEDRNHNGAPDHVYFFLRWLDQTRKVAEVLDNYLSDPHPRNIGKAVSWNNLDLSRTAADYARRAPAASEINFAQQVRIKDAFATLYSHSPQMFPEALKRLNQLRRDTPFNMVQ